MELSIEEKVEREIWQVLKQLKRDSILAPDNEYVTYEVFKPKKSDYPSLETQIKIINKLKSQGALQVIKKYFTGSSDGPLSRTLELYGAKPTAFLLDIQGDSFNEIFSEYQNKYSSEETENPDQFYIIKKGGDFIYNGKVLKIGDILPVKVFSILLRELPHGGEISYSALGSKIKNELKMKLSSDAMRKFILTNLTDKNNGFMHYAECSSREENGMPLLLAKRGKAIVFNNRK